MPNLLHQILHRTVHVPCSSSTRTHTRTRSGTRTRTDPACQTVGRSAVVRHVHPLVPALAEPRRGYRAEVGQDHGILARICLDGHDRIVSEARRGAAPSLPHWTRGLGGTLRCWRLSRLRCPATSGGTFWMFVQNFGSYIGFADQRCECAPHATPTAEFALPQTATVLVLLAVRRSF